jgi:hypothetical protein
MAIPSFDGPREGNSATSKLLPLDGHLSFSSLLKACLLSYSESSSTTSNSKQLQMKLPWYYMNIIWLNDQQL